MSNLIKFKTELDVHARSSASMLGFNERGLHEAKKAVYK